MVGFALRVLVLAFVAVAVPVAIVLLVPEGNDYALVSPMKQHRLATSGANRIVMVGGSNLAYGFDSALVEQLTGRPVTNMGMNGYFGTRYMLAEVQSALRSGDTVVLAFEYDGFFKSADGTPSDLMMAVKASPQSWAYLDPAQRTEMIKTVPYVAQQKIARLIRAGGHAALDLLSGQVREDPEQDSLRIETLAGFEEHGDLVSHLGVKWEHKLEDGYDLSRLTLHHENIDLMAEFSRVLRARGVRVIVSYTPVESSYYQRHQRVIDALHARMSATPALVVPSPPSAFAFPKAWFFDTVYHVTKQGRELRSRRVAEDVLATREHS